MSGSKDESGILDKKVHETGKFAHDGGDADFVRFTVVSEALIKLGENGVMLRGGDGGHIEDVANLGAAAADVASTGVFATVFWIRRDADQSGDNRGIDFAQFWHVGQGGSRDDGADPGDFL